MLVAQTSGLDQLQADLAAALHLVGAEAAPPRLRPRGGYTLNPSLVYAVTRVESAFAANAVSPAGAQGLMQLRPETAALVAGRGGGTLLDPGTNLRLGQRFLTYLSRQELAGNNLLRVLVAYNAGPSAAQKLGDGGGDPLLFIETLPVDETRPLRAAGADLYGWVCPPALARHVRRWTRWLPGAWPPFSSEDAPLKTRLGTQGWRGMKTFLPTPPQHLLRRGPPIDGGLGGWHIPPYSSLR